MHGVTYIISAWELGLPSSSSQVQEDFKSGIHCYYFIAWRSEIKKDNLENKLTKTFEYLDN